MQRDSRACWFGAGLLAGAVTAGLCAALGSRRAARAAIAGQEEPALGTSTGAIAHQTDGGADMFEYRGFVVHLFWQALGPDRYRAWCDIWEAGAVVEEAGGPPATYMTAAEARTAAAAWARHWIQNNA